MKAKNCKNGVRRTNIIIYFILLLSYTSISHAAQWATGRTDVITQAEEQIVQPRPGDDHTKKMTTDSDMDLAGEVLGSISGRVTTFFWGAVPNFLVVLYGDTPDIYIDRTLTDSNGDYNFWELPEGTYRIEFFAGPSDYYFTEWYNDKESYETADLITVSATNVDVTGIDAELRSFNGGIVGRVTDAKGTAVLTLVKLYNSDGLINSTTLTDFNGEYAFWELNKEDYKIEFIGLDMEDYIPEWYNNKYSLDDADLITVSEANETVTIDAVLERKTPRTIIPILQLLLL